MGYLTTNNTKTQKSQAYGCKTLILHLAPARSSGIANVCPAASIGCRRACLNTAGRGAMSTVQAARMRRTVHWFQSPMVFTARVLDEVDRAAKAGFVAVRLNGTSDLPWWRWFGDRTAPRAQFYDYTKVPKYLAEKPKWWHMTFSLSEENADVAAAVLAQGLANVAVPFDVRPGDPLPYYFRLGDRTYRVIDGDSHDMRWTDPKGVIVGLRAKGHGRSDTSGFVVKLGGQNAGTPV